MQKIRRQEVILNLIRSARISRQEELVRILQKKGFSVTQASVSRDLDELGIVKVNGVYKIPQKEFRTPEFGLLSLETAGPNLIVAKCVAGLASAAAVRIDAAGITEIVGTVAGDDTVFIAVKSEDDQRRAIPQIGKLFEYQ
ncbi:MAG: arginine repressor [Pyrinomonadaceae bacterium]